MPPIFDAILNIHIITSASAIILGPIAMWATKKKGLHTRVGLAYFILFTITCVSAVVLSLMNWSSSGYLFFVALFSYTFLIRGYLAVKRRRKGWLVKHVSAILGSYLALATAFLVISGGKYPVLDQLPFWSLWVIPTVIATPLIGRTVKRLK
jgi:uncharacterized membrane protein